MKKRFIISAVILAAVIILAAGAVSPAWGEEGPLPVVQVPEYVLPEVEARLMKDGLTAGDIVSCAQIGPGGDPWHADQPYLVAVTVRTGAGENVLYGFVCGQDGYSAAFRNEAALPQADAAVIVVDRTGEKYDGMDLGVAFSCYEDGENARETVWERRGAENRWDLCAYIRHGVSFEDIMETIRVGADGASYEGYRLNGTRVWKGTVQKDLRYFTFSVFPKTPDELGRKLTTAPAIPSGELSAIEVKFTGGEKYAVYSGPGENYLRGAEGRAAVSTNDWIQVFGRENGYILIQYAIEKDHMRFGYISASALPKGSDVPNASFSGVSAYTARACVMTDDPLFTGDALMALTAGSRVTWLATMGNWAYIETDDGPARGFVPKDALSSQMHFDLSAYSPKTRGLYVGSLEVYAGQRMEIRIKADPEGILSDKGIAAYILYNAATGDYLAVLDGRDADGYSYIGCPIPGVTGIMVTPQLADATVLTEYAFTVSW